MRVGINGFGRIGRLVLRRTAALRDIEVVAINDLAENDALTYLFRYDSVHGRQEASFEDEHLLFDGLRIPMLSERDPQVIDWGARGVDVVIDATGVFRKRPMAQKHLDAGAGKVLITAPAVEPDRTIVMGVNDHELLPTDRIVSNASCTTNCIGPVVRAIDEAFGLHSVAFTTIHAYTSSQALVDIPMRQVRRGRAAAQSMIPTTTGASEALGLVYPKAAGKAFGMAIRVPVPDGSLTDMIVRLHNPPDNAEAINSALRTAAAGHAKGFLEVSDDPLVSVDIIGNPHSSIVDALSTARVTEDSFKILAWYDNEYGYSCRVVDLALRMGA